MKRLPKISWRSPEIPPPQTSSRRQAASGDRGIDSGSLVHVIESDEEELIFLCDFLSIPGHRVTGSTDLVRGLQFVERMKPDILICNLATCDVGGDELLERTQKVSTSTRLILVSNWPKQPVVEQLKPGTGIDLMMGPFNAVTLLQAVERMLAGKPGGDPGRA
jgi:DNA-binding response OmpR family regulator